MDSFTMPIESITWFLEVIKGEQPFDWIKAMRHLAKIVDWVAQQFDSDNVLPAAAEVDFGTLTDMLNELHATYAGAANRNASSAPAYSPEFWRQLIRKIIEWLLPLISD